LITEAKLYGTIHVYWDAFPSVYPLWLAGSSGHGQVPLSLRSCTYCDSVLNTLRQNCARCMYVLYFAVSSSARANWATAKSEAEYSSESDGSSWM
jgi:hypothetical protein